MRNDVSGSDNGTEEVAELFEQTLTRTLVTTHLLLIGEEAVVRRATLHSVRCSLPSALAQKLEAIQLDDCPQLHTSLMPFADFKLVSLVVQEGIEDIDCTVPHCRAERSTYSRGLAIVFAAADLVVDNGAVSPREVVVRTGESEGDGRLPHSIAVDAARWPRASW